MGDGFNFPHTEKPWLSDITKTWIPTLTSRALHFCPGSANIPLWIFFDILKPPCSQKPMKSHSPKTTNMFEEMPISIPQVTYVWRACITKLRDPIKFMENQRKDSLFIKSGQRRVNCWVEKTGKDIGTRFLMDLAREHQCFTLAKTSRPLYSSWGMSKFKCCNWASKTLICSLALSAHILNLCFNTPRWVSENDL